MNKRKILALSSISVLLFGLLFGGLFVKVTKANPTWLFIHVISPQNMIYSTNEVPIIFEFEEYPASNETVSWMAYSLDNHKPIPVNGNGTLPELQVGSHNVIVYANDNYGFMEHSRVVNFTIISPSQSPSTSTTEPTSTLTPMEGDTGTTPIPYGYAIAAVLVIIVIAGLSLVYFKKLRK